MEIKTKYNNMDAIVLVIIVTGIGIINIIFCLINIYYNNKYIEKTKEYIETLLAVKAIEQSREQFVKIEIKENKHGNKN